MKKSALAAAILFPCSLIAQHKQGNISFYIGGGYLSNAYLQKEVFHSLNSPSGSGKHNCVILSSAIAFHPSKKWTTGISVTYDHFGLEDRSVEFCSASYMGMIMRNWTGSPGLQLSTSFSAGIKTWHKEIKKEMVEHRNAPAFQVCPLTIGYARDRFIFEISPGFGVSGTLQFGAWYRF